MKKINYITLTFTILLIISVRLFAQTATPPSNYNTSDGSASDPYKIGTLNNLYWLSRNPDEWDKHYIQTANINASATGGWDGGAGFSPIGVHPTYFTGSYNGQNHTIDGLTIHRTSCGLFETIENATIENIGVTNVDISGDVGVGGLVGTTRVGSTLKNCYSTGNLSGYQNSGGLVGILSYTTMTKCYSRVNVTGTTDHFGGLVGYLRDSSVSRCYSTGNVTGGDEAVGGLVGKTDWNSTLSDCYSTGSVSGYTKVGGLIGYHQNSHLYNSYSTGHVSGSTLLRVGGLIGYSTHYLVVNCFWNTITSNRADSQGGTGKTTGEMKNVATYTDVLTVGLDDAWDFVDNPNDDNANDNYWDIDPSGVINDGYPFLVWDESSNELPAPMALQALSGYHQAIPLNWKAPNEGTPQGYNVYRGTQKIAGNIQRQYYRDEPVNNDRTYNYKVSAVYPGGESDFSNTVKGEAETNGYDLNAGWAVTAPNLNGQINSDEWSNAETTTITYPGESGTVTLFVMNNANYLYIAVRDAVDNGLDNNDTFGIVFDDNYNRELPSSGSSHEGLLQIFWNGSASNAFLGAHGYFPDDLNTDGWSTPSGTSQAMAESSGRVQYEARIDLNSSPLQSSPGNTIGVAFYTWDGFSSSFTGIWPDAIMDLQAYTSGFGWFYGPFAYGDLTLKTSGASAPAAPTGLTATTMSSTRIDLNWTDNSQNESGFKIERKKSSAGWSTIKTTSADVTSCQDKDLSASTTFHYRVRAYNSHGHSSYSNTASATTGNANNPPITLSTETTQNIGSEFYVDIHVGSGSLPVSDLKVVSFEINFSNTSIVDYVSYETGPFLTDAQATVVPDESTGKMSISVYKTSGGNSGSGLLLRLKFKVLNSATDGQTISFNFGPVQANNSSGNAISLDPSGPAATTISSGVIVWPGDANNDKQVSIFDINSVVAIHWQKTGPARTNASMQWTGQPCVPWNPKAATYADCNGDGTVSIFDINAVIVNFGKIHGLPAGPIMPAEKPTTGKIITKRLRKASITDPPVYLQARDVNETGGGFRIDVKVGTAGRPVKDINVVSFELTCSNTRNIKYTGFEMGPLISKARANVIDGPSGKISAAVYRTGGGDSGHGVLLSLFFKGDAGGHRVKFDFAGVLAHASDGSERALNYNHHSGTLVETNREDVPDRYRLQQNYPNPFNPETTIRFSLPVDNQVDLVIYNLLCQKVRNIFDHKYCPAGEHTVKWDGTDDSGKPVRSGIYILQLQSGDFTDFKKMTVIK